MSERKRIGGLFDDMWLHDASDYVGNNKIDNFWTLRKRICTGCGEEQDGITGSRAGVDNDDSPIMPTSGSICVCSRCGQLNMFDDNLEFVPASQEVYDDLPDDVINMIESIRSVSSKIQDIDPIERVKQSIEEASKS